MDPVTSVYYATVCAALSVGVGPRRWPFRLISGAIVGLVAVGLLPVLRASLNL